MLQSAPAWILVRCSIPSHPSSRWMDLCSRLQKNVTKDFCRSTIMFGCVSHTYTIAPTPFSKVFFPLTFLKLGKTERAGPIISPNGLQVSLLKCRIDGPEQLVLLI